MWWKLQSFNFFLVLLSFNVCWHRLSNFLQPVVCDNAKVRQDGVSTCCDWTHGPWVFVNFYGHVEVWDVGGSVALEVSFFCFAEVQIVFFLPVVDCLVCVL